MSYVGRFAPSPTGPLHFGSLVAALASYLDARAHQGKWLIRIEDLDTARCAPRWSESIIHTLNAHGMTPDADVLFQSKRLHKYEENCRKLISTKKAYWCECTRKIIKQNGGVHDSHCRTLNSASGSVRFANISPISSFSDRFLGPVKITDPHALEDFVIRRRDNIFAYNFAVVIDDIEQQISHIVRGADLLETTSAQLSLYQYFNCQGPSFSHIPVVLDQNGKKLSKQNHAPALDPLSVLNNLESAAQFLGINTLNLRASSPAEWLLLATNEWYTKLEKLGDSKNLV